VHPDLGGLSLIPMAFSNGKLSTFRSGMGSPQQIEKKGMFIASWSQLIRQWLPVNTVPYAEIETV